MRLKKEYKEEYYLLKRRKDLDSNTNLAIRQAEVFAEFVERYFIEQLMNFTDACEEAYDILKKVKIMNINMVIPIILKYWLYSEEFESWLEDYNDTSYLLIDI